MEFSRQIMTACSVETRSLDSASMVLLGFTSAVSLAASDSRGTWSGSP